MKKVYILFNSDTNEVMAVSEDKEFVQELMYDSFMNDVEYEWYWTQQYTDIDVDKACEIAKDIWDSIEDWYNNYVYIFESEVI